MRHGGETKLSEGGTRGINSCETTVIILCGFHPSDRVSKVA